MHNTPPKPLHSSKIKIYVSPSALTTCRNLILMSGSRGVRKLRKIHVQIFKYQNKRPRPPSPNPQIFSVDKIIRCNPLPRKSSGLAHKTLNMNLISAQSYLEGIIYQKFYVEEPYIKNKKIICRLIIEKSNIIYRSANVCKNALPISKTSYQKLAPNKDIKAFLDSFLSYLSKLLNIIILYQIVDRISSVGISVILHAAVWFTRNTRIII